MPQMSPPSVRLVDPILSKVALGYQHPENIGHTLFPAIPVQVSGGQVLTFDKKSFRQFATKRAPGAATSRVDFGYAGQSFTLVQDALEGKVPREYMRDAKAVPGVDLGQRAVNSVMRILTLQLEREQATLATDPSQYGAASKVQLSGTDQWSDADNSDPTGDIETAKEAIRGQVGLYPNTLVLSAAAYAALKRNTSIIDRLKYGGSGSVATTSLTTSMLASLWDITTVVVGKGVTASGADDTFSDIWGNHAVLAYVPRSPSGQEEPSYGYTYTMQGHPAVEKPYYENNAKSWIYPVTYERAPVLTGIAAGYLIEDAVA